MLMIYFRTEERLAALAERVSTTVDRQFHRDRNVFRADLPCCHLRLTSNDASAPARGEPDLRDYASVLEFEGSQSEEVFRLAVAKLNAAGGMDVLGVRETDGKFATA
jgi:hypothetical protein